MTTKKWITRTMGPRGKTVPGMTHESMCMPAYCGPGVDQALRQAVTLTSSQTLFA